MLKKRNMVIENLPLDTTNAEEVDKFIARCCEIGEMKIQYMKIKGKGVTHLLTIPHYYYDKRRGKTFTLKALCGCGWDREWKNTTAKENTCLRCIAVLISMTLFKDNLPKGIKMYE